MSKIHALRCHLRWIDSHCLELRGGMIPRSQYNVLEREGDKGIWVDNRFGASTAEHKHI